MSLKNVSIVEEKQLSKSKVSKMVEMLLITMIAIIGIGFMADHYYNREKIDRLERKLYKK